MSHTRKTRFEGIAAAETKSVLMLIDDLRIGGAQRLSVDIARILIDCGHRVTFLSGPGELVDELPPGCEWVASPSLSRPVSYLVKLTHICATGSFSVIHAHQRKVALLARIAGFLLRVKVIEHVHSELPVINRRLTSYRSRNLIAVGPTVKYMLMKHYGRRDSDVTVIQNASADKLCGEFVPRNPGRPLRALSVGRIVEQKDPVRFVRFIAELQTVGIEVQARWVGDGPLRPLAESEAERLKVGKTITFVGQDIHVEKHLAWSDILVVLSAWEGLPLVILEALSAGVPVVAADVGSVASAVDSTCGWLVPSNASAGDAVALVASTISDPQEMKKLSSGARKRYMTQFSLEKYADRLGAFYQGVLER